jgi:hypothetical protein
MTATTLSDLGLSVAADTVADMPRHHPWRELRSMPEWSLHYAPSLPWGAHGWTRWADRTVWLRVGLTQVERRCALAHELEHVRRGPDGQGEHEEAAVEQATARSLIVLDDLVDAVRWSLHPREVADHLWVTGDVLRCRLEHLHPSEVAALTEAIRHHVA